MGLTDPLTNLLPRLTTTLKNLDYTFHPLHIFALIGIVLTLYYVERTIDFLFFHFAVPGKPLEAYRRRGPKPTYALITGATAGIGYGIAKALVELGFGVIILGHKEDELATAAENLRKHLRRPTDKDVPAEDYVKTIHLNAITATPEQLESALRTTVVDAELRVSILVNNVGGIAATAPAFRELVTFTPDEIDDTIALNARFAARITALMLPVLTHRGAGVDSRGMSFGTHRRSLVLNLSSGGYVGIPFAVIYCATKAFVGAFSRALSREMEADAATRHVDVLSVLPGDVRTQSNTSGIQAGAPDGDEYGRKIVERVDGAVGRGWREMVPFWRHHLEIGALRIAPEGLLSRSMLAVARSKRAAMEEACGKKKDE